VLLGFRRPSWSLATWVEELSSTRNELGLKVVDQTRSAEATIRYYLKEMTTEEELAFEKDRNGFDRLSEECWKRLTGEDGLAPQIVVAIYRAYRELTDV